MQRLLLLNYNERLVSGEKSRTVEEHETPTGKYGTDGGTKAL